MKKTFYNKEGKEVKRTNCLVYTRVMGYLSPTYRYNLGKKSEFYSRKYYSKEKVASDYNNLMDIKIDNILNENKSFVMKYATACGC